MNAVGSDDEVGFDTGDLSAAAPVFEHRRSARAFRHAGLEALDRVAVQHLLCAKARHRVAIEQHVQLAPMNRELRKVVACGNATRLAPDRLTMLVEIGKLGRFDRGCREIIKQTKARKNLHTVRQ